MIAPPAEVITLDQLRAGVARAAARAHESGSPVIFSQTRAIPAPEDPLAFFARSRTRHDYSIYWERPAEGVTLVGVGAARVIQGRGAARFRQAALALQRGHEHALIENLSDVDDMLVGPVYLGGFAFDPQRDGAASSWTGVFPDGLLVLPEVLFALRGGAATLTINAVIEPEADPAGIAGALSRALTMMLYSDERHSPATDAVDIRGDEAIPAPDEWKATVRDAAADIRAGRLEKVVLARELRIRGDRPFDPVDSLRRLRDAYPSAYVFAVAVPGGCFLGATPELLVRLQDQAATVTCLAGSIARGGTPEADRRLGDALLASTKDRIEHEIVACAIQEALAEVCVDVHRLSPTPELMRLPNVQHLYTPFRGRVAGDRCVLDLVEALHPTPAVGGYPRDAALVMIRAREGIDRGWYAGPVGWVNHAGEGEFAVALRSALLAGREASLYAGCGIVGDSDPDSEFTETCLKLRPMLAALGASR